MKKFFSTLLASILGTLIALGICTLFFMGMVGSLLAFTQSPAPIIPDNAILEIDLQTTVGEQTIEDAFDFSEILPKGLSSGSENSLGILPAVKAIRMAAEDPAIKMISIVSTGLSSGISISKAEELRSAIRYFHESGKPVIAYGTNFSQGQYYLASAADKIYSHHQAMNDMKGISTSIFFLKDLLDKLGINVQLIRHGKYKSAGEQFIANDISAANREQNEAMLKALWKEISESICQSRSIPAEEFEKMIDNLELNSADDMLKNGLIDGIMTMDEMNDEYCKLFGVENENELKTVSLSDYAKAKVKDNFKAKDKIAIIYADGEIVDGNGTDGIAGKRFASIVKKAREDKNIKGVLLRVNSPGGSAQAAEFIREELRLLNEEKPVVASFGDYAASGGYWISAECDKIFTNNTTLTGSIGVFSMIPEIGSALRKNLHVNPVSISTHKHSDMLSLMRPFDKAETAYMQNSVEQIYGQFLNIVSNGRNIPEKEVDNIAQGRVWAGSEAIGIRLADKKGGLIDALDYLANICELEDYRIVAMPAGLSKMEKLMNSMNQAKGNLDILANPELIRQKITESFRENNGIYARIPYVYEFRF